MGATQSKPPGHRRGLRQTLAPNTIESELMPRDSAQGIVVYNNNSNVTYMDGSGTIINNNTVTNYLGNRDIPNREDTIQSNISAALRARHVPVAVYDAQLGSGCMDGTRVQILREIDNWIKDPTAPQIFWLAGMAGTGKEGRKEGR